MAQVMEDTKAPAKLYRYRPFLENEPNREIEALTESYLYAPTFAQMNDPMEAFYELNGISDMVIREFAKGSEAGLIRLQNQVKEISTNLGLISFSTTNKDFPLWAYYASGFSGMCLEFDTAMLSKGELKNENLTTVTYAETPLAPLGVIEFTKEEIIRAVFNRKPIDWQHEKEWRYVTGAFGKRYYPDLALTRIYLGPRMPDDYKEQVCLAVKKRPVEVLQATIKGYEITFHRIQEAPVMETCDRIGQGMFKPDDVLIGQTRADVENFLRDSYGSLLEYCKKLRLDPNFEEIINIYPSVNHSDALCVQFSRKLRSGQIIYDKVHFNNKMTLLEI